MRISFEYKGNHGSVEIDDYAIVVLIDEVLFKPCTWCKGTGKQIGIDSMPYSCNACHETGKIRKF